MQSATRTVAAWSFVSLAAIAHAHGLVYPNLTDTSGIDLSKALPNDEQKLLRHIMRSYDKSVRPVFDASKKVTVQIGMTLTHIFNVDEKKQVLSMNVWLEQEWYDERILWNVEDFANITELNVPANFLWIPDIVLYNNAQDFSHGIAQSNAAVYPDGRILRAPPVKFHSTCKLDVSFFPFDDQICFLHFGSWIYDGRQLDVTNRSSSITIDASSFTENGEWKIVATNVRRVEKKSKRDENSTTVFPGLTFTLHLRRRTLYYLYNIIIPCIMLSVLTMMQFWLPCESGEKVTLGLTVLLAYSVFSFNIAENMPETSEVIPLIGIYMMSIMGISAVSVVFSVIVLNTRDGGERKSDVPVWLKYFAYQIIAPLICWNGIFCCRCHRPNKDEPPVEPIKFQAAFNSLSEQLIVHGQADMSHIQKVLEQQGLPTVDKVLQATAGTHHRSMYRRRKSNNTAADGFANSASNLCFQEPSGVECDSQRSIVRRAGRLLDRIEAEQASEHLLAEWRKVSRIFDRLFFLIIFIATSGVTLGLLLFAPRYSNRSLADELAGKMFK